MKRGLFVPGLFVTPQSQKFAALNDALGGNSMDIVDFSRLYRSDFVYANFVDLLKQEIDARQPNYVVTYSFGSLLYKNLIAGGAIQEVDKTVMIVPIGDYAASENGKKILSGEYDASQIYYPIKELKIAHRISPKFFHDMAEDGAHTAQMSFAKTAYMISGSLDEDVDPCVLSAFKQQNAEGHIILKDGHRMTRNMNLVCQLTRSFLTVG